MECDAVTALQLRGIKPAQRTLLAPVLNGAAGRPSAFDQRSCYALQPSYSATAPATTTATATSTATATASSYSTSRSEANQFEQTGEDV